jgi:hypothetical protein
MTGYANYSAKRVVKTYADLWAGASVLIGKAETDGTDNYYTTMAALLLTAFTFEAYLNDLGEKRIKFWPEIERTAVLKKYTILTKDIGLASDFSRRPHQTVRELFVFRNSIAHGKSAVLEAHKQLDATFTLSSPDPHLPKPGWEEYCTLPNAKQALADVSEIVAALHRAAGLGEHPFFQHTIGISMLVVHDNVDQVPK